MTPSTPVVAVWRSNWLPPSETFIRDHIESLQRWRPLPVGLCSFDTRLGIEPAIAPFRVSGPVRRVGRLWRRVGYRGVYEAGLRRAGVSLVHAHFGPDALEVLPVARRMGLPLVVTFHGYDVTEAPLRPNGAEYIAALRDLFDYASLLLPVSAHNASKLEGLGAPADITRVHYLGIPRLPEAVSADVPHASGSGAAVTAGGDGRSTLLFVGRLVEGKGIDDLIRAYAQLEPSLRAQVDVDIVGEGDERAALEALAASVDGTVRFHGRRPPDEVARMMRSATAFVGPSRRSSKGWVEGLGLVFLEAARAGVPTIGYRTGGIPEAVLDGETGLLVDPGDVDGLTAAMTAVVTDPQLRERLGRAGHERQRRDFDLLTQTARLEEIYDEVVARYAGGRATQGGTDA
ncbi:MAG: glycosyltransferase [Dermatophilus congolensis]|nr:glycosyltransferase [Dermatophilus congolensis]